MTARDQIARPPADQIASGDKRAVARFFNHLEDRRAEAVRESGAILDELFARSLGRGHVIGVTGPPGAGKSTLLSRFIQSQRRAGRTVGVIAVDPSSRATGGALLGDRVRFEYDAADPGVFVRSMASRGDYGGLADRAFAGSVVLRAAFDVALIETVGIGQSETDVASLVDTTLLIVQPGSGDLIQYLKAGIMETPHALAVNKSDHPEARRTLNDVRAALGHLVGGADGWAPEVLLCGALKGEGIDEVLAAAERHRAHIVGLDGGLAALRRRQAAEWIAREARTLYGTRGARGLAEPDEIARRLSGASGDHPFAAMESLSREIEERWRGEAARL